MNGGQVILADEPTGALDAEQSEEILALLKELSTRGHTVVVVSHDPAVVAYAARRVELQDGRIVADTGTAPALGGPLASASGILPALRAARLDPGVALSS